MFCVVKSNLGIFEAGESLERSLAFSGAVIFVNEPPQMCHLKNQALQNCLMGLLFFSRKKSVTKANLQIFCTIIVL